MAIKTCDRCDGDLTEDTTTLSPFEMAIFTPCTCPSDAEEIAFDTDEHDVEDDANPVDIWEMALEEDSEE
jgi:hypothetical protein